MADDDDRWTVRGVTKAVRDAAADAAQRRKVTVGAWLTGAIDREVRAEREPLDALVRPAADNSSDMADARLAVVERAVPSAVALANAPEVPTGFRRRANRLLRESLPNALPRVVAGDRRLMIGGGAQLPKPNGQIEPGSDKDALHAG
jgi:hypothetical protein